MTTCQATKMNGEPCTFKAKCDQLCRVHYNKEVRDDAKVVVPVCCAITRKGTRCTYKGKYEGVCGVHKTRVEVVDPDIEQAEVLEDEPVTNDDDNCVICHENGTHIHPLYPTMCCSNLYHEDCITRWFTIAETCPSCRHLHFTDKDDDDSDEDYEYSGDDDSDDDSDDDDSGHTEGETIYMKVQMFEIYGDRLSLDPDPTPRYISLTRKQDNIYEWDTWEWEKQDLLYIRRGGREHGFMELTRR